MVLINYATKEIVAKVVYYGPGLCGKTTNLQYIYTKLNPKKRGKMISLSTEADRTLFFDFLPIELGVVQGFKVRFQVYTVPGQVFYSATRKLVLKGADAVVFVADSQSDVFSKNVESLEDMKLNLLENGLDPETIPIVFQYNKRDLSNVIDVMFLDSKINYRKAPKFDASAITGMGVMETFRGVVSLLVQDLKRKHSLMNAGIGDIPPDMFEPKPEPEPPEVELELEMGSAHDKGPETANAEEPESILDMMETITLADSVQAEVFFDNVRQGVETEEAKKEAESAGTPEGMEASNASEAFEIERELTPEELIDVEEEISEEEIKTVAAEIKGPIQKKPEPREQAHYATNSPQFDIMPVIEKMTKLEEGMAALTREISALREKKEPAPATVPGEMEDIIERKIKDSFEGHEQLLLSLLEAVRELKKNSSDANDRIEDILKGLASEMKPQKKKWF